jgi:DNA-binding response OmpR family regulator
MLRENGHEVLTASTLADARRQCEMASYDLLVADMGLPDGDVIELAMRAKDRGGQAIALTGYGLPNDMVNVARAGFETHLLKPVSTWTLLDAVDAGVRHNLPGSGEGDRLAL